MTRSWFKYRRDEAVCQGGGVFSSENPAPAGFSLFGSLLVLGLLAGEAADRSAVITIIASRRRDIAQSEGENIGIV